jgi:hypothetical protein
MALICNIRTGWEQAVVPKATWTGAAWCGR